MESHQERPVTEKRKLEQSADQYRVDTLDPQAGQESDITMNKRPHALEEAPTGFDARSARVGSIVTYSAFGRKSPAIVLAVRSGEVSHLGAHDEPMLTLALIDPARETGLNKDKYGEFIYPVGRFPNVFIEHDVVHASHEFDDEFLRKHGSSQAEILAQRGHGEWTEFTSAEASKTRKDNENSQEPGGAGELIDMSRAERKQELGGMKKAELRDTAEQHGVQTDDSMTKGEITSALNKQLNKEAK